MELSIVITTNGIIDRYNYLQEQNRKITFNGMNEENVIRRFYER